jgi:hypothetical protein
MWLTRLAFWSAVLRGIARCSGAIVPKLFPSQRRVAELAVTRRNIASWLAPLIKMGFAMAETVSNGIRIELRSSTTFFVLHRANTTGRRLMSDGTLSHLPVKRQPCNLVEYIGRFVSVE